MISITTDRDPPFVGNHNKFINFCKYDDDFPSLTNLHRIIHQIKILISDNVMNFAFKIVTSYCGSNVRRRRLRELLEEYESDLGELLLLIYLRWLRGAKSLKDSRIFCLK